MKIQDQTDAVQQQIDDLRTSFSDPDGNIENTPVTKEIEGLEAAVTTLKQEGMVLVPMDTYEIVYGYLDNLIHGSALGVAGTTHAKKVLGLLIAANKNE